MVVCLGVKDSEKVVGDSGGGETTPTTEGSHPSWRRGCRCFGQGCVMGRASKGEWGRASVVAE
ncbi:MAG: hypothetical protein PF450_03695 [Bacteroidales bacterium]|nr:hypothetical protein [Bacteroidales bacterium]